MLLQTQIVEPLIDVHPLLGVIAFMFISAIAYLLYQNREAYRRLKEKEELRRDQEIEIRNLAVSNVEIISTLGSLTQKLIDKMDNLSEEVSNQLQTSLDKIMVQLNTTLDKIRDLERWTK